ncbi:putative glucokinase [Oceaniovalibus guishaninsula JLT2003]|uniref:Putative glucokinase n=1 Tax=Oceaniovalibus guishaninsula JLT2003 TaxID=1231392 RepID=K2I7R0_9RHOB|nr:glucokinase [Oceaniovalibus guishaninsula]EKE45050.1 putative glucokinase [Oceaniovalibus guishaninsula JLT2003]
MLPPDLYSVVADVGGTNTRAALALDGVVQQDTVTRYRNADASGLGDVIGQFMAEQGNPDCAGACIAMAGPVMDGVGRLTNVGWVFDRDQLARATRAETVAILNDLQAQGHAMDHIAPQNLLPLVRGPRAGDHNAKLVIGVGTGFNAVPVFRTETGRYVPPCEAGHAGFPVLTEEDWELSRHIEAQQGFPAVEDVLSGPGLERIYAWRSGGAEKKAAAIMTAMEDGSDPLAAEAVRIFVQGLGRVTGDLALLHLPYGGIYLIGGVARAMVPYLDRFGFETAMRAKGRFATFMEAFAVWAVDDDYAALTGCAMHLRGLRTGQRAG